MINQAIALARRQIRSRSWCVVILILQPILFFWRTLISKTTHIPWDLTGFHAPLVSVVVEGLKEGRIPLWDPYTYAGYPLHADIAVQLFYPPAWLVFLLGVIRDEAVFYWLEWLIALHLVLAGIYSSAGSRAAQPRRCLARQFSNSAASSLRSPST